MYMQFFHTVGLFFFSPNITYTLTLTLSPRARDAVDARDAGHAGEAGDDRRDVGDARDAAAVRDAGAGHCGHVLA